MRTGDGDMSNVFVDEIWNISCNSYLKKKMYLINLITFKKKCTPVNDIQSFSCVCNTCICVDFVSLLFSIRLILVAIITPNTRLIAFSSMHNHIHLKFANF